MRPQAEFAGSSFTALPHFFNWRPYCAPTACTPGVPVSHLLRAPAPHAQAAWRAGGNPPETQWTRDAGGQIYILHVHGPKLDKAICVLDYAEMESRLQGGAWLPEQKKRIASTCTITHHQVDAMLAIMETAYRNDKGRLYRL